MEFTTREDIEAPIEYVFEQVTDFASFERSIMRRGGDVERISGGDSAVVGTKWHVKFLLRGAERVVNAEVVSVDAPNAITIDVTSKSANATLQVDLVALSPARTRLNVRAKATAKSIPAKLLFQSVKFARSKNKSKFNTLVANFAEDVETRYRS
ncbi:SRPBCC family protein [Octadecabacter ascidiaceicola]|uniref:Polyketide cyclase / dehydrase and lipid transport n=1 Tax=Octadecabacter ascidiaceicola TaxID=1655543 RepID=A0A238KKP6_9RHOB|nr:SRPBCC family protein [Octadecabacter ascidiaceicola]SMX43331.1 Polyketide cyclase / dehydrase and lipid transport [Octadecabacter ascidiaceicola]